MTKPYMFLTCLISGSLNPIERIDVFLQPLISDLKRLWINGEWTYDIARKDNFTMKTTLMWTFPIFLCMTCCLARGFMVNLIVLIALNIQMSLP